LRGQSGDSSAIHMLSLPRFSEKALDDSTHGGEGSAINEKYGMRMDHTYVRGAMLRLAYGALQASAARTPNRIEIQIVVAARVVTVKAQGVDTQLSRTKRLVVSTASRDESFGFVESVRA
jgi:hypothetical protein